MIPAHPMKRSVFLSIVVLTGLILLIVCGVLSSTVIREFKKMFARPWDVRVLLEARSCAMSPDKMFWNTSRMRYFCFREMTGNSLPGNFPEFSYQQPLLPFQNSSLRSVIPLYLNPQWRYIVIHHSATKKGNGLSFNRYHLQKGFGGVGYDFVIDNGTNGEPDGQIEITPRWLLQEAGVHCRAFGMNDSAIGICLVGNFNRQKISKAQMTTLVHLIGLLRDYYRIPLENIMGHGQVPGANTDCPGKRFPWFRFVRRLKLLDRSSECTPFGREEVWDLPQYFHSRRSSASLHGTASNH
jgi:hypothetical protein